MTEDAAFHPDAAAGLSLAPGSLLLSAPDMLDPTFMHAIVLMLEHGPDGSIGFIVNKPRGASLKLAFDGHPQFGDVDLAMRDGGPVGEGILQIVHRFPGAEQTPAPGRTVFGPVKLVSDLESMEALLRLHTATDEQVRFFVGYAGWAPGQLKAEIEERSWLPLPPDAGIVFAPNDGEAAWRDAMKTLTGGGATLAHLPPDPNWN